MQKDIGVNGHVYRRMYEGRGVMKLKEGKNHHTYVVEKIRIELNLERRLEALGLTDGAKITVLNNDKKRSDDGPFPGDPFCSWKTYR